MRRFIGYISIAITLIIAVVFNVSLQTSSLNTGLEYGPGYEAVYRVDFEESTKGLDDIVEILTQREFPLVRVLEDGTHVFASNCPKDMFVGFSYDDLEGATFTDMYHF